MSEEEEAAVAAPRAQLSKEEQLMESRGGGEGGAKLDVKVKKSGVSARVQKQREISQREVSEEHVRCLVSNFLVAEEQATQVLKEHSDDLQAALRHMMSN